MNKPLQGEIALVTGASRGIGAAIADTLAAQGATVIGTATSDAGAAKIGERLSTHGGHSRVLDVSQAGAIEALVDAIAAEFGAISILVNNAGVITRGPVTDSTDADWTLSLGVNVEAPFRICRAAIPLMAEAGGGAIVNVSSCWGGKAPGPNHALYCMTKAAIASLTQCMGMDHAHQGIRVNAVCPNEVNTPMLRTGFARRGFDPNTAVAELGRTVPIGRIAEPEDIADVVLFLASDAARYMCGALVEINGGKPVS